jgi:hypothetical protein
MYYGAFEKDMAVRFIKEHLLNSEEFFTNMPIPSIAVNDPVFRNNRGNDWSGQSEGLTWQRSIRAFEEYGMLSELALFGKKFLTSLSKHVALGQGNNFPQQFDPFTGEPSGLNTNGDYGPMALSVLEYISRFYGIHVQFDEIWWGCISENYETCYIQNWGECEYRLETKDKKSSGFVNDKMIFEIVSGKRVVTDWEGNIKQVLKMAD